MLMSADMFGRAVDRLLDMPFVFDTVCAATPVCPRADAVVLISFPVFRMHECSSSSERSSAKRGCLSIRCVVPGGENATFNDFCRA